MQIISISGSDGVGKSEQTGLLGADKIFNLTGHLVDYGNRWPKTGPVEFFNWWFRDVPFLEFVSIVLEALICRRATYKADKININDRGTLMFKAVSAATLFTREYTTTDEAASVIDRLFERELQESAIEQEVLLRLDPKYAAGISHLVRIASGPGGSSYLPWQEEVYARYQSSLAYFIDHYYRDIDPGNVVRVDSCIIDVNNKLRAAISKLSGTDLHPVCESLETLVAFGGLSECGKSSFAERLSTHHQSYRLKIKYFGELIRGRGLDVGPVLLGRELLDFFRNHKHVRRASIESLHGVELPAYLKLLFGSRLKIVYLDTPEHIRIGRTAQELGVDFELARAQTVAKDSVKLSCGADKVKYIADVVFSNERDGFETAFSAFVEQV